MSSAVFSANDTKDLKRDDLIPLAQTGFFSTAENLSAESDLIKSLRRLKSQKSRIVLPKEWLAEKRAAYYDFKKDRMDSTELQGQLKVVYDELVRDERVSLITGPPGAAKTVVTTLWVKLAREHDPSFPVTLITQEKPALERLHEKFGFQEAQLSLLGDILSDRDKIAADGVVIVDEAGLLGTAALANLLHKIADSDPRKVILIGDDKQLLPVQTGQPFRWLRENKKILVSELCFPYRQKDPALRQIVLDLYARRVAEALSRLDIGFATQETLIKKACISIGALAPERSLVTVHGGEELIEKLRRACPGYRIYSMAAAQGLAVDQAVLILAEKINMSEFLVGCSRARYDFSILIDASVYASLQELQDTLGDYPKRLMALDIIDEDALLSLAS